MAYEYINNDPRDCVRDVFYNHLDRKPREKGKMHFDILNIAPSPIPSHAYAALLAVFFGGLQLVMPKGTNFHRYLGYTWIVLLLWVSISSFWIQTIKIIGPFSPIHFLSIFTIWSIFESIRSVRNGNIKRHKLMMKLLYILALIVTGLFTLLPGRIMNVVLFGFQLS